jgi:hypothetical protein
MCAAASPLPKSSHVALNSNHDGLSHCRMSPGASVHRLTCLATHLGLLSCSPVVPMFTGPYVALEVFLAWSSALKT